VIIGHILLGMHVNKLCIIIIIIIIINPILTSQNISFRMD